MPSADVIVVGAGPAGAWSAYCLARQGAGVTVFDHSHPREKPCGGGLTRRAWQMVAPVVNGRLRGVDVVHGVFEDPRTTPATVDLKALHRAQESLVVVSRREFDQQLLDAAIQAGATHQAERVIDVALERGRAYVRTERGTHRARWVIGADGANSLVRRRLQRPFRRDQLSIACGAYAHGRSGQSIVIRFVSQPPGYIWSFPRPDHLALGICAQADLTGTAELRGVFDRWLADSHIADGLALGRYVWPIPSLHAGEWQSEHPAGPAHLLVGDAAGLVDPITREGIYFALQSAELASAALSSNSTSPSNAYCQALSREILPELDSAARLKHGFFRGSFTRLLVDAIGHSLGVQRVAADLIMGAQSYRTLKLRLVRTFEWRLAWQLLRLDHGKQ